MSKARAGWLAELAHADTATLETAWSGLRPPPAVEHLRPAEHGLAMVRGRTGGTGRRFNLGEMTVSRCAVRIGDHVGHGYVAGRDRRKAELVASFDALLQDEERQELLLADLIRPLAAARAAQAAAVARRAAATRVEFFTLVRGDE